MFDAGPLGYLSLAAHGHADALAVTVSSGETDLVVDPGTGSYFRRPDVREAFRGTGFHPTISIDSLDQSTPGGPFLWSRHARSWFTRVDLQGVVSGEQDGYLSLADPVRHQRALVALEPTLIVVYDRLEAEGTHTASLRWPLHPSVEATLEVPATVRANMKHARLLLTFAATVEGNLSVDRGVESPFLGWYSPRLEELVPAPLVRWESSFSGKLDVVTILCPLTDEPWPEVEPAVRRRDTAAEISLDGTFDSKTLYIDFDHAGGVVKPIASHGHWVRSGGER